jgi:hypothetical protein
MSQEIRNILMVVALIAALGVGTYLILTMA